MPFAASAERIGVTHTAPKCLPDRCTSEKLIADVVGSERIDQVVIYFHAESLSEDYWVTMRPSDDNPGRYWGFLPVALSDVDYVDYRIEAIDEAGRRASTDTFRVEVSNGCAHTELTDEEKKIARNLVIGFTKPNQKAQPPGFRCGGIVALVNAQGDMMPNEECREKMARDGDDLLCPVYWKKTTLVMGTGVLVGGVILIDNNNPKGSDVPEVPLSTARP